jgi:hypothetical protein
MVVQEDRRDAVMAQRISGRSFFMEKRSFLSALGGL